MASPSMVHRTGDTLVVRSVVSGDQLFKDGSETPVTEPTLPPDGLPEEELEDELDLPQCKIKRNYICQHCNFFTQNPRSYLYHLKDVHKEKIKVYECPHCLYASKHSQKLQRHIHMIHIRGPIRRRAPLTTTIRRKKTPKSPNFTPSVAALPPPPPPAPPSPPLPPATEEEQMASASQHFLPEDSSPTEEHSMEIEDPEESSFDPLVMDDSEEHEFSEEGSLRIDDTIDSPPSANEENDDIQGLPEPVEDSSGEFKCSLCSFQSSSQVMVNRHERMAHLKKKFYRCSKCNYVTHMKARYTKHVKYHSMPMIKCDLCDFRTPYKWNLDRHHKNHEGRGQFKCVACNFTAEIKQSLTVHEMNHHVPPVVGIHKVPANGPIGGRRRNKVGASDSIAQLNEGDVTNTHEALESEKEIQINSHKQEVSENITNVRKKGRTPVLKLKTNKKQKSGQHPDNMSINSINNSDFIHPDDIVHRSNGTVYIKHLKCQHCPYKSAWPGEITRHEARVHGIIRNPSDLDSPHLPRNNSSGSKKAPRPIPNLIPIQGKPTPSGKSILKSSQSLLKINQSNSYQNNDNSQQALSERDLNEICAKSCPTSALKDFASLIGGPDAFKIDEPNTPPKSPNASIPSTRDNSPSNSSNNTVQTFKRKNASFFDKLKEKLMGDAADGGGDAGNLVCSWCGHQSKCLSEQARHQKLHSKTTGSSGPHNETDPVAPSLSTRCQYCRQRCKSSHDLANHILTCQAANDRKSAEPPNNIQNGESSEVSHPMENRVFVWNHLPEQATNPEQDQAHNLSEISDISSKNTSNNSKNNRNSNSPIDETQIINRCERSATPPSASPSAPPPRSTSNSPVNTPPQNASVDPVNENLIGVETAPGYGAVTMKSDDSTHTIKKVFRCPHCSFWASTASRFHVHIVGHLNKKPFECSLCAYRSNWRWDITKHIRLKSARDMSHMFAKVLMTDETGRRNYTKYNKYLAVMKVQEASPADIAAMGNRKSKGGPTNGHIENSASNFQVHSFNAKQQNELSAKNMPSNSLSRVYNSASSPFPAPPKLIRAPTAVASHSTGVSPLRPPPPLRAAHPQQTPPPPPLRPHLPTPQQSSIPTMSGPAGSKKTLWKCKKCSFKHVSREAVLNHVRDHYEIKSTIKQEGFSSGVPEPPLTCTICPYTSRNIDDMTIHKDQHTSRPGAIFKCYFCPFYVSQKKDLLQHMTLHGVNEPEDYISKAMLNKTINNLDDSTKAMSPIMSRELDQNLSDSITLSNIHKEDIPLQVMMDNYTAEEEVEQLRAIQTENHINEQPDEADDFENDVPDEDDSNPDDKSLHFCQYCPARFLSPRAIEMHIRYHRLSLPHACTSCSYSSRTAEQLSTHIKVHSDSYQDMTECLAARLTASNIYPKPRTAVVVQGKGLSSPAWVVIAGPPPSQSTSKTSTHEIEKSYFNCPYCPAKFLKHVGHKYHVSLHGSDGPHKCRHCNYAVKTYGNLMRHELIHRNSVDSPKANGISLSGTDLYQQRIESNNSSTSHSQTPPHLTPDPQFGTLIHGNPDFVYSTYLKNGRLKEKRYKCHKCPTAFEKRDQYKVHVSLHGSKQKYECEKCDYSVKYYANYIQHIQKHEKSEAAQAEKREESSEEDIPFNDISTTTTTHKAIKSMPVSGALKSQGDGPLQLSTADKQYLLLQKARSAAQAASAGSHREAFDFRRRNVFCPRCPFYHTRRDRVDAHLRGHYAVSRTTCEHKCKSCDFSTNNLALSKEHTKLHFNVPIKAQAEIFAKMDGIELWTDNTLLFQDKGSKITEDRFLPVCNNINKSSEVVGEKIYINLNGVSVKYEEEKINIDDTSSVDNHLDRNKDNLNQDEKKNEIIEENSADLDENTNDQLLIDVQNMDTTENTGDSEKLKINSEIYNNSEVPLETNTNLLSGEGTAIETEDTDSNSTSTSSVSSNNSNAVQNINENSSASTSSRSVTEQLRTNNFDGNIDQ